MDHIYVSSTLIWARWNLSEMDTVGNNSYQHYHLARSPPRRKMNHKMTVLGIVERLDYVYQPSKKLKCDRLGECSPELIDIFTTSVAVINRMPNTPDMCGQKSNPQRIIWGLKNIRIRVRRVDGVSMHFQYHINALREYFFGYGNVTSRREFWGNVWVRTRLRTSACTGQVIVKKTGSRWKLVGIRWHEELTAVAKCFLGAKVIKSLNKKENSKMFKPQEFLCKL